MGSPAAEALRLGEELLKRLRWPLDEAGQAAVDRLLEEREQALRAALEQTAAEPGSGGTLDEVRLLAAQQRALQEQAAQVLKALESGSQEAQAVRTAMQGVNRMLNPGVRSRYVDEKR